jgi:hypothetical protein
MTGAFVAMVIILGVPGKEPSHDAGDALFPALKETMDMVAHQRPGVNRALTFHDRDAQAIKESGPVLIVTEYVGLADAPHHDVMQCAGDIESGLSWHGGRIGEIQSFVKFYDLLETTSPRCFNMLQRCGFVGFLYVVLKSTANFIFSSSAFTKEMSG